MTAVKSRSEAKAREVRAQRDRILASTVFSRSKRQSDFLDYVVNAALEGRADDLKEFAVGIDVFEKDESFDPNVDSIVRVEASRLRSKLREYYDNEGRSDAVRIDIPKGHYVPVFTLAERVDAERGSSRKSYLWIGLVVVTFGISVAYVENRSTVRPPAPADDSLRSGYSIAVLPLRDWSDSPQAHFSEAMTDALVTSLANVRSLRVTSLTSVMRFDDTEVTLSEIGRRLGVEYVVEGSVLRDGEYVRISAQLIAADTDTHLWAKTFDRPAANLLAVQSEIAADIAAQISVELSPPPGRRPQQLNPAAYEAYLKGRYFYNQFTADGFRRSMKHFNEAIDIEPDYAEAYAGLASCHCLLAGHGLELVSPIVAIPESQSLAAKALDLNPSLAEPHAFLGIIHFKFDWDLGRAETMLNRAIELNPSLFQGHIWYSQILEARGRHDDAVGRARFAKQLNPLSLAAGLNLAWQLYQADRLLEANAEVDELIEFDDTFWGAHWAKGHLYVQQEMHRKAIEEFQRAVELGGGHSLPVSALGYSFAKAGRLAEARRILAELHALSDDVYVSPFHIAIVYAGLDDPDRMFEWLERAYQVRARSMAWLHVTGEMEPYHDDARFQDLLKRVGVYEQVGNAR